jgi:hypothetical protein
MVMPIPIKYESLEAKPFYPTYKLSIIDGITIKADDRSSTACNVASMSSEYCAVMYKAHLQRHVHLHYIVVLRKYNNQFSTFHGFHIKSPPSASCVVMNGIVRLQSAHGGKGIYIHIPFW